MLSPSGTVMVPNGEITQVLRVMNPNKVREMLLEIKFLARTYFHRTY